MTKLPQFMMADSSQVEMLQLAYQWTDLDETWV